MEINNIVLVIVGLLYVVHAGSEMSGRRDKREGSYSPPLVAPYGGTFKLIVGIGIPIYLPGRSLIYGQNFQFQYALPQNASTFTEYFTSTSSRRRRSSMSDERAIAYQMLEHQFERNGAHGKECMMRSICEAAETPLHEEGLVGELLHVLLTPDYGGNITVDEDYIEAKEAGRRGEDCAELFPACQQGQGILDRISTVGYVP